jgi:hyperosmotically inducible protein
MARAVVRANCLVIKSPTFRARRGPRCFEGCVFKNTSGMEVGVKTKKTIAWVVGILIAGTSVSYAQGGSGSDSVASGNSASQSATSKSADRALQKRVRAALAKAKGVTVSNITVRAHAGAVMLQGTVPGQEEIERAGDVAKGVTGVNSVKNSLTVRTAGQ